ncbi:MAG: GTPase HflX, partial [Candidatus Omnitrophota bacterium]
IIFMYNSQIKEKALLVTIKLKSERNNWRMEDIAEELEELTTTSRAEIVDNITCFLEKPTPTFFIGRGKAEEIALIADELEAGTVVFSRDLSGTQQRNLEEILNKKTIDRTQLILDIFARHAHSPEGKMQVELAQLQYLLPRLSGKGIVLSRLGGGIGTRGPGEQKLEVDRRRIRKRIDKLKSDLKDFTQHRLTIKKKRKEKAIPNIALVGYTNAGKSTLLNTLTKAGQIVAESMFTTLDPVSKSLVLPGKDRIVISDTVGFLSDLPHHLIEAFRATLEVVIDADLLIHVLDVSHPRIYERNSAVLSVLKELGAGEKPIITALNKIDSLEDKIWLDKIKRDFINPIAISAKFGENIPELLRQIENNFSTRMNYLELSIPHSRMDLVDLFYREGRVKQIEYLQEGIKVKLKLPRILSDKLLHSKEIKKIN